MKPSLSRRLAAAAGCIVLCSIPLEAVAAESSDPAAGSGELWEVTSQMSMEGMPMAIPAQKSTVCAPKEWKEPPSGTDERQKCRASEFKIEGPKATWKVACAGPPAMSGTGEIVRDGAAAWSGALKLTSPEAGMTVKLSGKKLGGCEPGKK